MSVVIPQTDVSFMTLSKDILLILGLVFMAVGIMQIAINLVALRRSKQASSKSASQQV